ncbi:MAG: DUF3299 domain-containing protein [Planctomycetaceae bacterium]
MSQVLTERQDTAPPPETASPDEFDYHPIPPLAPIALFLGVCASAGLLVIPGLAIGVVGFAAGAICAWQIRRSDGELGGRWLARLGCALSAVFLVSGIVWHSYVYATEVPEGYERVSFPALSKQMPEIKDDGSIDVPAEVAALDGKPIFIKGYMYPTRQKTGIQEFVLVKDTGQCCFGGNPKLTDMIVVQFQDGMTVDHREQTLVAVAGTFHAKSIRQSGELTAIYSIDGTHFK